MLFFPEGCRGAAGRSAGIRVLAGSGRAGAVLLDAARHLTARMPLPRLPAAAVRDHRSPAPLTTGGTVAARTYPPPAAEVDPAADVLRPAHLEAGLARDAMPAPVPTAPPPPPPAPA